MNETSADDELIDGYCALRWALRDLVYKATGVLSNPGWGDDEIVATLAAKCGVPSTYDDAYAAVKRYGTGRLR